MSASNRVVGQPSLVVVGRSVGHVSHDLSIRTRHRTTLRARTRCEQATLEGLLALNVIERWAVSAS